MALYVGSSHENNISIKDQLQKTLFILANKSLYLPNPEAFQVQVNQLQFTKQSWFPNE